MITLVITFAIRHPGFREAGSDMFNQVVFPVVRLTLNVQGSN
jgi:hypothetical protein